MRFLHISGDGRPWRPTRAWLKSEADPPTSDAWSLHLDKPLGGPAEGVFDVSGFKTRLLTSAKDTSEFKLHPAERRSQVQHVRWADVLTSYLDELPIPAARDERVWVLMPSLPDPARQARYRDAILAARPDALILPEPEMTLEYFRLVKGVLSLRPDHNGLYLVIDSGASTTHLTFVLTNRDGTVVDAKEGRRRIKRLRPVHGTSAVRAGQWVDERLAAGLGWSDKKHPDYSEAIRRIEKAKIAVSRGREPATLPGADRPLTEDLLADASVHLWDALEELYHKTRQALFDNLTSSDDALRRIIPRFEASGVASATELHRLIDGVILAGGTSQLPGFREGMRRVVFGDDPVPPCFEVKGAFAVAAALGGLAHVLHQQQVGGSRLVQPKRVVEDHMNLAHDALDPTSAFDLKLKWRRKRGGVSGAVVVLKSQEAWATLGGQRAIEGLPPFRKGEKLELSLSLGAKHASRSWPATVQEEPGEADFRWVPEEQTAHLASKQIRGAGDVWLDLKKAHGFPAPELPLAPPQPANRLQFLAAPEVVVDLGASKTVVVTAVGGALDVDEFERTEGMSGFYPVREPNAQPLRANTEAPPAASPTQRRQARTPTPAAAEKPNTEHSVPTTGSADLALEPETTRPTEALTQPDPVETEPLAHPVGVNEQASLPAAKALQTPKVAPLLGLGAENVVAAETVHERLLRVARWSTETGAGWPMVDLIALTLALQTRPFVLLAGPPGCGKSTLVRLLAHAFGLVDVQRFHELLVLPHWTNKDSLIESDGGTSLTGSQSGGTHLVLLDEINLARPENYLWAVLNTLDAPQKAVKTSAHALWVCGTLNIDDASRPPSPKVVDRGFLVEIDAPHRPRSGLREAIEALPPTNLSTPDLRPVAHELIGTITTSLRAVVNEKHLRQDLLPSHRALDDVERFLALQAALPSELQSIFSADDALDRAIAGRLLVKLAGAAEQVEPVIEGLEGILQGSTLPRSARRLKIARSQLSLGFVSPWQ